MQAGLEKACRAGFSTPDCKEHSNLIVFGSRDGDLSDSQWPVICLLASPCSAAYCEPPEGEGSIHFLSPSV